MLLPESEATVSDCHVLCDKLANPHSRKSLAGDSIRVYTIIRLFVRCQDENTVSESPLARAMRYTSSLKYDDLRALLSCIHFRQVKMGLVVESDMTAERYAQLQADAESTDIQSQETNTLLAAFAAMTKVDDQDLGALAGMIQTLADALQPDEPREDERGYLELRWVPRLRWNLKEGIARVWYGPYAYLRHRNANNNRDVYKLHYLGRDIADLYSVGQLALDEIIKAHENSTMKKLKKRAKEQVADIPDDKLPDPPQPPAAFELHAGFIGMVNENKLKRYEVVKLYTPLILNALESGVIKQDDLYNAYRAGSWDDLKRDLKRELGTDDD